MTLCRKSALDLIRQNVPVCLRERDQWVCWRYVNRDGAETKVPFNPLFFRPADSSDSTSWTTFDNAVSACGEVSDYDGVGYVFSTNDPYCGIDLDKCLGENGEFLWGREIVEQFGCYTEISPSGRGVKLFFRGRKPAFARCEAHGFGPDKSGRIEIYDHARYFTITGRILEGISSDIPDCQQQLDELCRMLWPPAPPVKLVASRNESAADCERRAIAYLDAMPPAVSGFGGHNTTFSAASALVHGFGIAPDHALQLLLDHYNDRCKPPWTEKELTHKVLDAAVKPHEQPFGWLRDADRSDSHDVDLSAFYKKIEVSQQHAESKSIPDAKTASPVFAPNPLSIRQLLWSYPELRPPLIHGLLRRGETMNVIASPKMGKSWLTIDLALALATGRPWLNTFETIRGDVLIIDNELHPETTSNRIPRVAEARQIPVEEIADHVYVENIRGRLKDILSLGSYFQATPPGRYSIIVLDALYRFLPRDTDENDNGMMANIYNYLDVYAAQLGCSFVLVHHSTKGNQTSKAVTDVGAGAGSQARATDTHLILRPHEQDGVVVLDAATRSWPPIAPFCMRWAFPVWIRDDKLDPTALRLDRPRRKNRADTEPMASESAKPEWTPETFSAKCIGNSPNTKAAVLTRANDLGLSDYQAEKLLTKAEAVGLVHRWHLGGNRPGFANIAPPNEGGNDD
jgi:hypothetical protein